MVELTTALPDYPASVVLDRAPPCQKGTHCLQCRTQGGNQGTRRPAEGGLQHRRWAHAMFPTQKQQLQLAVRPPAWSRRQSGLREDNVLKLHCTQFSQCGQPVWEVQPALPPALCWRRSSSLPLPRLMWLWRQREGRGLILLFILNRLSTSLTVPFEQGKKKTKREWRQTSKFTWELSRSARYARFDLMLPRILSHTHDSANWPKFIMTADFSTAISNVWLLCDISFDILFFITPLLDLVICHYIILFWHPLVFGMAMQLMNNATY